MYLLFRNSIRNSYYSKYANKLNALDEMLESNTITEDEYNQKKNEITNFVEDMIHSKLKFLKGIDIFVIILIVIGIIGTILIKAFL